MEVGVREVIYLSLHCHHQNDFCIRKSPRFLSMQNDHRND